MTKSVSLVITSCNRLDLLKITIESFEKFNTYPISQKIIIEDSGNKSVYEKLMEQYGDRYTILFNEPPLKLIGSVDRAYSYVDSDYIFHCEDDWEFQRSGFIEDSFKILDKDPKVKQVGLRSLQNDLLVNHYNLSFKYPEKDFGIKCYHLIGNTFTFTPSLLRKKDYDLIGKYSNLENSNEGNLGNYYYYEHGFYCIVLENHAIKHLGWERSTMNHPKDPYVFTWRFRTFVKSFLNLLGSNYKL